MAIEHLLHFGPLLSAICGPGDPVTLAAIVLALFLASAIGGFAHCAPMCGPFVLMQLGPREGAPALRRLAGGALPVFHLGRLTTYTALGAAVGDIGGTLVDFAGYRWSVAALLSAAALVFLVAGLKGIGAVLPWAAVEIHVARMAARFARLASPLLRGDGTLHRYLLGVVLGFLPCGFLYAALLAAAAAGTALAGALAMAAFALGTLPALFAVGILGSTAFQRWRHVAALAIGGIFVVNGLTLAALALRTIG